MARKYIIKDREAYINNRKPNIDRINLKRNGRTVINPARIFKCIVCGKEGITQGLGEIKPQGNCCSHECDYKRRTLSPEILKEHKKEWARNYYKRPEIKEKQRLYRKEHPIHWRDYYLKKKEEKRIKREERKTKRLLEKQLERELKLQLKEEKAKRRTHICEQCGNPFIGKTKYCSRICYLNKPKKPKKKYPNKGIRKEIFDKMREECNYTCKECGQKEPFENQYWKYLTQDHIIPRSRGGKKRSKDNIQPLCWDCNLKKSNKLDDERSKV